MSKSYEEDLDKILSKSFQSLKKNLSSLINKYERAVIKEQKAALKGDSTTRAPKKEKSSEPVKPKKRVKKQASSTESE